MIRRGYGKRIGSILLAVVVFSSTCNYYSPIINAADSSIAIDANQVVTIEHVKDSALLAALKSIVKGDSNATMTLGELTSYDGEIDLTPYADQIKMIQGLGYARKAWKIDFSGITSITEIPDYEFDSCNASEILMPPTVTKIGNASFKKCGNLRQLDLSNVTYIGEVAFQDCVRLEQITFHDEVKVIGNDAFSNCSTLEQIEIRNPNVILGAGVFAGCTGLFSIDLPEGLQEIPTRFLRGTTRLQRITVPSTIKVINQNAFYECGLSYLDLTNCTNLTDINGYAFAVSSLLKIDLPDSVERIGSCAFNASSIESIQLPESLTSLGVSTFANCTRLYEVRINDALPSIEETTFKGCSNLESVIFSETSQLERIGVQAFLSCYNLPGTQFLSTLTKLTVIEKEAFANCSNAVKDKKDKYNAQYYEGAFNTVILPDSVETLGEGVFKNSKKLEYANLGEGITVLPTSAFAGCSELKEVQLPEKLQIIGTSAFESCVELENIKLSDGVKEISESAFSGCGAYRNIPGQMAVQYYVEPEQLQSTYEKGLQKVYYYVDADNENNLEVSESTNRILKTAYTSSESLQEQGTDTSMAVLVDTGVSGKTEPFITGYEITGLKEMVLPNSLEVLGTSAFSKCITLERVVLSSKLSSLGKSAFEGASYQVKGLNQNNKSESIPYRYGGLREVTFVENLVEISSAAFKDCYNLELQNGYLPNSLVTIGDYAFQNGKSLSKVVIPQALQSIGNSAFSGCGETEQIKLDNTTITKVLPEYGLQEVNYQYAMNLTSIGTSAFYNTPITSVTLPQGVTKINDRTFSGCWYLKSAEIPNSVTAIGKDAFANCYTLNSIILPSSASVDVSMISGYTNGSVALIMTNVKEHIQVECNGGEAYLPINVCNTNTSNDTGLQVKYLEGTEQELEYEIEEGKDGIYRIKVIGIQEGTVKLEVKCALKFLNSRTQIVSTNNSFEYVVTVTGVPCEEIQFDETNQFVNGSYVMGIHNTKGILLSAQIKPEDSTDLLSWKAASDQILTLAPSMVEGNLGQVEGNTALVTPSSLGVEKVTLTAGAVSKDVFVNVVVPASSIAITDTVINLYPGIEDRKPIQTTVKYASIYSSEQIENYPEVIKYTSSNPQVATVDSQGYVTAVAPGEAQITVLAVAAYGVSTSSSFKKTVTVYVHNDLHQIQLSDLSSGEIYTEDSVIFLRAKQEMITLGIITDPVDSKAELVTTAEDASILTSVLTSTTSSGRQLKLQGKGLGFTYVYVEPRVRKDSEAIRAKIGVNVYSNISTMSLYENRTVNIEQSTSVFKSFTADMGTTNRADLIQSYTTDQVVFSSDDTSIATVDASTGVVTGVGEGRATITVTWTDHTGNSKYKSTFINVERPAATTVTVQGPTTAKVGDVLCFSSSLTPVAANNKVTYSLYSGSALRLVNGEHGTFQAVAPGVARIKATTDNGKVAYYSVTVTQPATSVSCKFKNLAINVGSSYTIASSSYMVAPNNTTDRITWSSSNVKVATVSTSGRVMGVSKGTAVITGTYNDRVKFEIKVTILQPATSITLNKATLSINKGKTATLVAKVGPMGHTDKVTWQSSNSSIATVDANGKVTGKAAGTVKITASTTSGRRVTCTVTVKVPATSVKIKTISASNKTIYVAKGTRYTLAADKGPSTTTDQLTWSSSKKSVAKVDAKTGQVMAVKTGTATITCKATSGKKTSIKVVVVSKVKKATKVTLASSRTVKKGKTLKLTASVTSSKSTDTLMWSTSNGRIATVDRYGNVKGIKKGSCDITVKTSSGKTAKCKIKVK